MPQGRYRLDRVNIELKSDRPARWKIREEPVVRGTEYVYGATDGNYAQRNQWEFLGTRPEEEGELDRGSAVIRAGRQVWNGMERRAMMFERIRRGRNVGDCYCKVALADPAGERTRLIARVDERRNSRTG